MPGIFQSLDIARKALWASRMGMDVTSHNIANVNTLGYSRQRVDNRASHPLQLPQGQLGLGVDVEQIRRIRNSLLDEQYRQTSQMLGYATAKDDLYSQIEIIVQEPGQSGLSSQMNEFFMEFSDLSADPENTSIRNMIREKGLQLVESFHNRNDQLTKMKDSLKNNVMSSVDQINEITRQIAELNGQISTGEIGGSSANDLRDRRDMLLDRLSEFVKINYSEDARGNITVVSEGMNLVSGVKSNSLTVELADNEGTFRLDIRNSNGQQANLKYGKLGASIEMYNKDIPSLLQKLDTLAAGLVEEFNRIHSAGQGLPTGDPPTPSTGINFFSGNTAGTINLTAEILESVTNIAASNDGSPGNGDVAYTLANIRNTKLFNGGSETLEDYYSNLVKNLAVDIESTRNTREGQQMLQNQVMNQREAQSGVSLDEEMTNLITFQRSFEAAAKVIQAVDEIMETVVNLVR